MENIKIDVYSHGIPCQTYEFYSVEEQTKHTISVLWCNINRWGAQETHYDLLLPIREEVRVKKTFRETFYDKVEEDKRKRNWKANYESNYISRSKWWKEAQTLPP
eukprot:15918550-Heterocapsa_arctica.AAC.1